VWGISKNSVGYKICPGYFQNPAKRDKGLVRQVGRGDAAERKGEKKKLEPAPSDDGGRGERKSQTYFRQVPKGPSSKSSPDRTRGGGAGGCRGGYGPFSNGKRYAYLGGDR